MNEKTWTQWESYRVDMYYYYYYFVFVFYSVYGLDQNGMFAIPPGP